MKDSYQHSSRDSLEATNESKKVSQYRQRISKVKTYIDEHLDKNLSLQKLAEVADFPVVHLKHLLTALLGEPLQSYIGRLRLQHASHLLIYTDEKITDIASLVGYETQIAFTQAFKEASSLSPLKFRAAKRALIQWDAINPEITTVDTLRVLYVREEGSYEESFEKSWERLIPLATQHQCITDDTRYFGLYHNAPDIINEERLSCDAMITYFDEEEINGMRQAELAGGLYAIFLVNGSHKNIAAVYDYIFSAWYPLSQYQIRKTPSFIEYLRIDRADVNPQEWKAKIYIPIQPCDKPDKC